MRVITEGHQKVEHGEFKSGIVMHNFLSHFDETFNKSSHILFSDFFAKKIAMFQNG